MERVSDKRLKELRNSGKEIYSISRIDSINQCLYSAYRTYILKDRGKNNVYALLGGKIHDELEKIMNGESTEDNLINIMNEELDDMDMLEIRFPNDAIKDGWINNMTHFCNTYKAPKGKFETETLFIYKTKNGNYLQGYIDLTKLINDKEISIYDYKTSSMYKGEAVKEHGRQLMLYAMGKEQEGYSVKEIAWIMLKYCEVKFLGKKTAKSKEKTQLSKVIERRKMANEMSKYVEQDLFELGYDELDIEIIINDFKNKNSFDVLPDEIKHNYKMLPCVIKYDITEELKDECESYIDETIKMWESLDPENELEYPPRKFTRVQKNGKEVDDSFFCTCLCGHSQNCPYLQEYLATKDNKEDDDNDLF